MKRNEERRKVVGWDEGKVEFPEMVAQMVPFDGKLYARS